MILAVLARACCARVYAKILGSDLSLISVTSEEYRSFNLFHIHQTLSRLLHILTKITTPQRRASSLRYHDGMPNRNLL